MQRCWFGDHRDLWKWTVVFQAARGRRVAYVALDRTPDDYSESDCDPLVRGYFRGGSRYDDIAVLGKAANIEITPFLHPYRRRQWREYFQPVLDHLSTKQRPAVLVLLDPDTGLWTRNPTSAHLRADEVTVVWEKLRTGDGLLVYQHRGRQGQNWWEPAAHKLATHLGVKVVPHWNEDFVDVVLLQAERT